MPDTETPTHTPCCSSHGVDMTCEKYRRTHFVETRPCCTIDQQALAVGPCIHCDRELIEVGGVYLDDDRRDRDLCPFALNLTHSPAPTKET